MGHVGLLDYISSGKRKDYDRREISSPGLDVYQCEGHDLGLLNLCPVYSEMSNWPRMLGWYWLLLVAETVPNSVPLPLVTRRDEVASACRSIFARMTIGCNDRVSAK